jgi:hypothetical protein
MLWISTNSSAAVAPATWNWLITIVVDTACACLTGNAPNTSARIKKSENTFGKVFFMFVLLKQ